MRIVLYGVHVEALGTRSVMPCQFAAIALNKETMFMQITL